MKLRIYFEVLCRNSHELNLGHSLSARHFANWMFCMHVIFPLICNFKRKCASVGVIIKEIKCALIAFVGSVALSLVSIKLKPD